ncbi:MAG: hypothetical protein Kow0090_01870 [Myxococcota bacterium]
MLKAMEAHRRSIAKAISYRIVGTIITSILVWVVTGELKFAAVVGFTEPIIKSVAFYIHERMWNNINFGRPKPPEYQI